MQTIQTEVYEERISELKTEIQQLKQENRICQQQRSIAISNLRAQVTKNEAAEDSLTLLQSSIEFWSNQIISSRNSREKPYSLREYYEMHNFKSVNTNFRPINTSFKRFIKCLCDLDLLKTKDFHNEFLTLSTIGATEKELSAGTFYSGIDSTYITEKGLLTHSGLIRYRLLQANAYQKINKLWYKRVT